MTTDDYTAFDDWRCPVCGVSRVAGKFHYLAFDYEGIEYSWALICLYCWPKTTLQERLAIYAERSKHKNNGQFWGKAAEAIWAEE